MNVKSCKFESGKEAVNHEFCRIPVGQARGAFSLIEILVTVAILSIIILGLVAMFNQTRRAFTSSMTQVDVLEAGRTAADMISRELEQLTPANAAGVFNFYVSTPPTNIALLQPLTDPTDFKTNILQQVYFVIRSNMQCSVVGYRLTNYADGIGTLYRFGMSGIYATNNFMVSNQWNTFLTIPGPSSNFSRIIDGVVDFRIRLYGTNGVLLPGITNANGTILVATNIYGDYPLAEFSNDAVPAFVELELGVLEDRALAKYQALASAGSPATGPSSLAWGYLSNHAAQVHIFRQRIPIRNVNPAAYQ